MAEQEKERGLTKEELRHKRRVRNQIIAYTSIAVIVLALAAGAFFGIKSAAKVISDKKEEALAKQLEEQRAAEEEAAAQSEEQTLPETEEYTEDDLLQEVVDSCLSDMSMEDKIAGLFIVTPEAITGVDTAIKAGDGTKEALSKYPVGGLVYFAKNIKSEDQFKEMVKATVGMAKYPLFYAVDEEGGKVARLGGALNVEKVPPMGEIGASGDASLAYGAGSTIASYMKEYGLNLDFAPVADVLTDPDNKTIGDRSFGTDPAAVGEMAAQAVKGLQENGVSACLKHFPGLGGTQTDTHKASVSTDRTLEQLQAEEFVPFRLGIEAGADFVMVSHLSAPAVNGDDTPSSLSGVMITELLRGQLGFEGIVVTDALNMKAVTDSYSSAEAAVKALQAGADMLLMPENFEEAYQGVLEAVNSGTIPEERIDESLERILKVKYRSISEN